MTGPEIKNTKSGTPVQSKKSRVAFWRRVIAILVSVLLLAWYFSRVDWVKLEHAFLSANLWMFFSARLIPVLIYLFVDAYLLQRLIVWYHRPFEYKHVLYARASLYIFSLINPQVSNGGMFLYVMRRAEIGAEKLFGLVAFRFTWSIWSINFGITLALIAVWYFGLSLHSVVEVKLIYSTVGAIWVTLFTYLLLVYHFKSHRPDMKHRPFWTAFYQATPRHCLVMSSLTLLLAITGVFSNFFCATSFGIDIPFHELMILLPIADIISTLPVAFLGLGTTTLAWETLWKPYASKEAFLSFTIALPVVTYLMRALIALVAMPAASKEIQLAFFKPEVAEPGPEK
jgi:hypothetical protein